MLDMIRIVLIQTSHPGNIGAAARAMKTMGLNTLYLVSPKLFPHEKAIEMASGAVDILEKATVLPDLNTAIADCSLVIGTSARSRSIPWPLLSPRELAEKIKQEKKDTSIAILFGCEQWGLTNDQLQRCHFHVHIPSFPEYSSLNLAAAVQIIAYELRLMALSLTQETVPSNNEQWDYPFATLKELESFFYQLEKTLIQLDFLNPNAPRQLMTRLRRFFNRARPDKMEINIFRGILSTIQKWRNTT